MLRSITFLDVLVVGSCLTWLYQNLSRRALLLPPGPPRLPLIGNVFDMPKSHLWEKAAAWKKEYGISWFADLIHANKLPFRGYNIPRNLRRSARTP